MFAVGLEVCSVAEEPVTRPFIRKREDPSFGGGWQMEARMEIAMVEALTPRQKRCPWRSPTRLQFPPARRLYEDGIRSVEGPDANRGGAPKEPPLCCPTAPGAD